MSDCSNSLVIIFANLARSLDFSDVNDLLRTQQAFVDGTVAAAPPPPPLHIPLKPPPPPPPKPKAKKQPAKRKSEVDTLSDVNHRALPTTSKRTRKPNQQYKNDFI